MLSVSHSIGQSNRVYYTDQMIQNQPIVAVWQAWAQVATGSMERRDKAVQQLIAYLSTDRQALNLSRLGLTTLPDRWPYSLTVLNLEHNNLTQLPGSLPNSIEVLRVNDNQLTNLPRRLPSCLALLDANNNQLNRLPENLPFSLKKLYVANNRLVRLPRCLPPLLVAMNVDSNPLTNNRATIPNLSSERRDRFIDLGSAMAAWVAQASPNEDRATAVHRLENCLRHSSRLLDLSQLNLTALPNCLPADLKYLYLDDNQLRQLPEDLPSHLVLLSIVGNRLIRLPERLPSCLECLDVSNNRLSRLPNHLPARLRRLDVRNNQIRQLPEPLPTGLTLCVLGNPIATSSRQRVDGGGNNLSPNLYHSLFPNSNQRRYSGFITRIALWTNKIEPWYALGQQENAVPFSLFLERLYSGYGNKNVAFKRYVSQWLDYLAKERNRIVREQTFLLAHEASESCVDRASFYFNRMYMQMIEDQLVQRDAPIEEIVAINRGLFRLQLLEQIAAKKVIARRRVSPGFKEDIEVYLAYQYQLRKVLALPIYAKLHHIDIAQVTKHDLKEAVKIVAAEEQRRFLRYLVIESASWKIELVKWNKDQMMMVDDDYLQQIVSEDFEQAVDRRLAAMKLTADDADARRTVSKQLADDLLYEKRYPLTIRYLIEKGKLVVMDELLHPTVTLSKRDWLAYFRCWQ